MINISDAKNLIKRTISPFLFKISGGEILSIDKIKKIGVDSQIAFTSTTILVPDAINFNSETEDIISGYELVYPDVHIFKLDRTTYGSCLKKWGSVVLPKKQIIPTGIDIHLAQIAALLPNSVNFSTKREEELVIAPWPHLWASYGDFIIFVLPKLCRLLASLTASEKSKAVIILPYKKMGEWAYQYLELLGFSREQLVDLSMENVVLSKSGTLIAGDGPSFAQYTSHPGDIACMRKMYLGENTHQPIHENSKRLYISRKHTRRLVNESYLFSLIEKFGIEFFEDKPRTAKEQIDLFKDTEFIIGPHGAGLSNLVWGTNSVSLVEVKSSSWNFPCFRNLCAMRNASYGVLFDQSLQSGSQLDLKLMHQDLNVQAKQFEKATETIILGHR